ncbi:MAG: ribosome silencing factor [Clostridiales bacterium]|nr:ribosome silencing factor [Clostridiales bacterium]
MIKEKGKQIDEDTIKSREFIKKRLEKTTMKNKETALNIAKMLSSKKAFDIAMIDISEKSSFADFFVNASVSSERQLNALAEEAQDFLFQEGYNPRGKEGRPESGWILIDGGDIIVNIFDKDVREKYSLDKIWSDCNITIFE